MLKVGLKINKDVVDKLNITIKDIADWFTPHHNGVYVIGLDSKYFGTGSESKPHYHVHFFTDSKQEAVKTMKSKKLSELKDIGADTGGRTTKMYIPKEKDGAEPLVFIAYAIKEEVVWCHQDYKTDQMELLRKTQLEVKKLRSVYQSKEQEKKDKKKDDKELMFEYIKENYTNFIANNEEFTNKYGEYHNHPIVIRLMIQYLVKENRYGSLKKVFLEMWFLEYSCKYLGKTDKDIYAFIFK